METIIYEEKLFGDTKSLLQIKVVNGKLILTDADYELINMPIDKDYLVRFYKDMFEEDVFNRMLEQIDAYMEV